MKYVFEMLDEVKSTKKIEDKIQVLQSYNSIWALKDVLRGTYDTSLEWDLPKGAPPFEANQGFNAPANLLQEHKQFKYLVIGEASKNLPKLRREMLYIKLLESIHPKDAEVVINMTSQKNITGISKTVVQKAFPNLIPT